MTSKKEQKLRFNNSMKPSTKLIILFVAFCPVFLSLSLNNGLAAQPKSAKTQFFNAASAYKKLRHNSKKKKYRENWLKCIGKYQAVYEHDPQGPWAAAGLYKTAILYYELSKYSYASADRQKAVAIHQKIIKNFPESRYRKKAEKILKKLGIDPYEAKITEPTPDAEQKPSSKPPPPPSTIAQLISANSPSGNDAPPEALSDNADRIKKSNPERKEPVPLTKSPKPSDNADSGPKYADKKADTVGPAPPNQQQSSDPLATIDNLRYWSNPNYTRVVIDLDQKRNYTHRLLKKDPSSGKPQRLYIDLPKSRLKASFQHTIPINDNLLKNARAGQYSTDDVRVVIDIKSFKNYKIFSLTHPFRIVIDVWGRDKAVSPKITIENNSKTVKRDPVNHPPSQKLTASAIAKQLALGVRRIVIDPGHGGKDYGAPGYYKGVHEKYIVLKIAKKLAETMKKELNCEVFLTRDDDRFLTLEERTAFANTQNADLFISIHTNASKDRRAYGTETYFLNLATDNDAILVAARENATTTKNISDLQTILNDLMQNAKINESSRLAVNVESAVIKRLKKNYSRIKSKGVKQAPFYVLLGAQMPAILIETGFISNSRECRRLNNAKYQDRLCRSISFGIKKYMFETNPTAFIKDWPDMKRKGG